MTISIDTHVLLWWKADGRRLSRAARRALAAADEIAISPVVFWEVAVLAAKGRIALDRDLFAWVADVLGDEQVVLAPLSAEAAADAGTLRSRGFTGDPADSLIYATTRELAAPLVSKDAALQDFARTTREVRVIW